MNDDTSQQGRVLEADIDLIFEKHLGLVGSFSSWLFSTVYENDIEPTSLSARKNVTNDFRYSSGDSFAYGESDVQVLGVFEESAKTKPHAILIENKVDADQMPNQGLRYQARAKFQISLDKWLDSRCILVGPQRYLDSQYAGKDFRADGWDALISLETMADKLMSTNEADAAVLTRATTTANAWNKPIPAAVDFWHKYENYQRTKHPDVLLFLKTTKGSKAGGVWPSFYDNHLRNDKSRPELKRVQVVHMETNTYISLFIKRVNFDDFRKSIEPIMESDMRFPDKPGKSWQSIQLTVPAISVLEPFEGQEDSLDAVFAGAERMYRFFREHEALFLSIPKKS